MSQGEIRSGTKKVNRGEKIALINTREKGEADRMKEELREIAERKIEDMRKEIWGWLEREIREIKREVYNCMEREIKSLKKK